jgi:cell division protein FtsB
MLSPRPRDARHISWRRRRRARSAFTVPLIAASLLAALVAAQPVAAHSARVASVVPDGLFTDLVQLDRKLAKLIHDERTKGLDVHQLRQRVDLIARAKLGMVDQFFDQPVYGVRFNEVFRQLDCLDVSLENAVHIEEGSAQHPFAGPNERIVRQLEAGKKCKQKLEGELHGASLAPEGLLKDLVQLDRKLAKLIHDERTKGLDVHQLRQRVDLIARAKLGMVDQFFDQHVYGVKFSEVFTQLDSLDVSLENAVHIEEGSAQHPFAGPNERIARQLEAGKKSKQKLEDDLHKANAEPPAAGCTGHAMLGNIYGGQAHELVTDFTCPKPSTEFSLTVPVGYQITGGQASNAASSGGYTCSLNSTNTTVDCIGSAPAGSTTYVQMTSSPNPQAGMMLPLKVSFSDNSTASFTLTSK